MDLILFVIIYALISIGLIQLAKSFDCRMHSYDTTFCRDIRANLGMIAYSSDLEETRAMLNSKKSKF
jgi:hypothetical protein